jgi:hypothetical protein
MAEALVVIGIIANVIALVDFSRDILDRAGDFGGKVKNVPKAYRDLKVILPLVGDTLGKTKEKADAGDLDDATCKAIKPVLQGCETKLAELKAIFEKVVPPEGASHFTVFVKAISSVGKDKKVEAIAKAILDYVAVLTYHHAEAAGLSRTEKESIITAMSSMSLHAPEGQDSSSDKKALNFLSLDGGGLRGLSILIILGDIMAKVNQSRSREEHLKPCDIFDLIGGTGTGGYVYTLFSGFTFSTYRL